MSQHWVEHTPSTAHPTYCIIPRSTVFRSQPVSHLSADHVVLNSLHSRNYKLTNEQHHRSCRASLPKYCRQIDRLLVLLQSFSITASKCISTFAGSRPPDASPNSLNRGLQLHLQSPLIAASTCISELVRSRPPTASPKPLDHGHQLHLQTRSIVASMCISNLAWLRPPSASRNSLNYSLRGYLLTRSITAPEWISTFTRSRWGETLELEGRQPMIDTPSNLAWHPKGIREKEWFWLEVCRKRVTGSTQIEWIYESLARVHATKSWEK